MMNRLVTLHESRLIPDEVINRIHELRDAESLASRAHDRLSALHVAVKVDQGRLAIEKAAHDSAKRAYEVRIAAIERREAVIAAAELALAARVDSVTIRENRLRLAEIALAERIDRLKGVRILR
jgi:hypothetical protein